MTVTTNIDFLIVEENQNSKEVVINNNMVLLDKNLSATLDIDVAAGGTILTARLDYQENARFRLTGAPAGAFILEFTSTKGFIVISNQSGQTATVRSTGTPGDTIDVVAGEDKLLYNTGSVGENILDISGTGGGGTSLTITTIQTTDATVTDIVNISLASGESKVVRGYGIGFEPATEDAIHFDILAGGANTAGTSRAQGKKVTELSEIGSSPESSWVVDVIVDDTTDGIIVQVKGEAAKTINWEFQYEIIAKT